MDSVWSFGADDEEPPVVGPYTVSNGSATVESPMVVSAFFIFIPVTVEKTLPNYVLATPSYTTCVRRIGSGNVGEIVASELAISTDAPILTSHESLHSSQGL